VEAARRTGRRHRHGDRRHPGGWFQSGARRRAHGALAGIGWIGGAATRSGSGTAIGTGQPGDPPAVAQFGATAVDVGPVTPGDGSAGARMIAEARKYLGVPYVTHGATPDGFDCSGYTMWVYSHAGVAQLPHFADSQREQMHEIPESAARPGDLIFYLDGDDAYHVAIYADYGMQYAAPAPGQDVKLEPIWSSDISFGTDWH
jgi:cell wall-associated NlpC family hydrolase